MTREKGIKHLAEQLAARDGVKLSLKDHGLAGQRHHAYMNFARAIVSEIERSMKDFSWHPETMK